MSAIATNTMCVYTKLSPRTPHRSVNALWGGVRRGDIQTQSTRASGSRSHHADRRGVSGDRDPNHAAATSIERVFAAFALPDRATIRIGQSGHSVAGEAYTHAMRTRGKRGEWRRDRVGIFANSRRTKTKTPGFTLYANFAMAVGDAAVRVAGSTSPPTFAHNATRCPTSPSSGKPAARGGVQRGAAYRVATGADEGADHRKNDHPLRFIERICGEPLLPTVPLVTL